MKSDHHLFYAESVAGGMLTLGKDETHHACAALRLDVGERISVTDGKGGVFLCELSAFRGKTAEATVLEKKYRPEPTPRITVMIGLPDKRAFESALKALAPLGVTRVLPLICRYCQKNWWEKRWGQYRDRFRKTIVAAAKQALNPHFTRLQEPTSFEEALAEAGGERIFYAHRNGRKLSECRKLPGGDDDRIACIVGPPGGFSPDEVKALEQKDAVPLRLARCRLRTELAAVVASGCIIQEFR